MLSTPVRNQKSLLSAEVKSLVSTELKRRNRDKDKDKEKGAAEQVEQAPCLEKSCHELVKKYLPLCGLHYHQCVSGKCLEVELKDGLGMAKFNSKTQTIDYPTSVPKDKLPIPASARPRKGLMLAMLATTPDLGATPDLDDVDLGEVPDGNAPESHDQRTAVKVLGSKASPATVVFYVDSGAGQCLSSCSTAFRALEPCQLEVVRVAGSLPIFGIGTAIFALTLVGESEVLVRVHNLDGTR